MRVAIVGAGHVGATTAYSLMLRGLFREIVLIDSDHALAEAEAADLADANALMRPVRIWAGGYSAAHEAEIAILTAGAATSGNQSRLTIGRENAGVVAECAAKLADTGFAGTLVVATNPVDIMSLVAYRHAHLPAHRIIGTGTLLDSSRLQQALSARLGIAARAVDGFALGEHGDSQVMACSTIRIGGMTLEQFGIAGCDQFRNDLAANVRTAAYEIITGKGYTSFGIAAAVLRICEALLRDEDDILPVSVLLNGEFGLTGIFMSLPCILGSGGVERILTPELSHAERCDLIDSAGKIRDAVSALDAAWSIG